ncbi:MAG: hypothetical protein GQ566_03025 [Methanosarcinales archaeon]|nr:hypothetical protein [Methanosarcinales archaeon]
MESFEDIFSHGSVLLYGHKEKDLYETVYQVCLNTPVEGVIWVCYKHPPDTVRTLQSRYDSKVYKLTDNMLFLDMISGGTGSNDDVVHCSDSADYDCMLRSIYNAIGEFGRCVIVFDDMKEAMSHDMFGRFVKMLRGVNNDIQRMASVSIYLARSGIFDPQTEKILETSVNAVIELEDIKETMPESIFAASWGDLARIRWRDVFSLNVPVLYLLLMALCVANVILAITLSMVISRS